MVDNIGLATRLRRIIDREQAKSPHSASIRRLAAECDVSHTYLRKLVSGEQCNPTVEVLERVAKRFHTTVRYLYHGDRRVNIWQDLMQDHHFIDLSRPTIQRGERFSWVSRHLAITFPGHLEIEDQAETMGIAVDSLMACLAGQWEPTDYQVQVLSDLSGVPERWFKFGSLAFVDIDITNSGEISAQIGDYWKAISLAIANSMPPHILEMAIKMWVSGQKDKDQERERASAE